MKNDLKCENGQMEAASNKDIKAIITIMRLTDSARSDIVVIGENRVWNA
jgi:hypothetical protein